MKTLLMILLTVVPLMAQQKDPFPNLTPDAVCQQSFTLKGKVVGMRFARPTIQEVEPSVWKVSFSGNLCEVFAKTDRKTAELIQSLWYGKVYIRVIRPSSNPFDVEAELLGNVVQSNGSQLRPEVRFEWQAGRR
jgi:hypothetical protein